MMMRFLRPIHFEIPGGFSCVDGGEPEHMIAKLRGAKEEQRPFSCG